MLNKISHKNNINENNNIRHVCYALTIIGLSLVKPTWFTIALNKARVSKQYRQVKFTWSAIAL